MSLALAWSVIRAEPITGLLDLIREGQAALDAGLPDPLDTPVSAPAVIAATTCPECDFKGPPRRLGHAFGLRCQVCGFQWGAGAKLPPPQSRGDLQNDPFKFERRINL